MNRRPLAATIAAVVALTCAGVAGAAPALIATRPIVDPETGECVAFAGGIDENGRSLKVSSVEVMPSGERTGLATSTQSLSDWAATVSEHSRTWSPPLAVGLVYLWVKNVPKGVLDGIHAFFQRVPSRTTVLPTVYGRMRQGRASLIAADISRLDEEVPPLENYRPNLIEAVRLDLADLSVHPAPIKILLLVTDGRDFADPKGQGPGDFSALGREIRKAGVMPLIVGYPPEADALQSTANLRELHAAAGGVLRLLEQPEDLENALESLGQAIGDVQRVQFPVPWSWRAFGASHRVSLRLMTGAGKRLNADAGTLDVEAGSLLRLSVSIAAVLAVLVFVGVMWTGIQRRRRGQVMDDDALVTAAHALIRRGTSPQRAVEELTRTFAEVATDLVDLDPDFMDDPRFPYFRTRLGRQRMEEIRDLLANKSAVAPKMAPVIAEILAGAVSDRTAPDSVAEAISARATADEWMAFAGMGLEQLAEALRSVSGVHAVLGTPRARGAAVAVQDALRVRGSERRGIVVGWLVRAAGSGRRGDTLRLQEGRTLMGTASQCQIQVGTDPGVVAEHAEIRAEAGEFTLVPLGGGVSVEAKAVDGRHVLSDGETIQIGKGLFVFKMASAGNLLPVSSGRPRLTARRRTR